LISITFPLWKRQASGVHNRLLACLDLHRAAHLMQEQRI
jgi:hypothetical protein